MRRQDRHSLGNQNGFTLVEVVITAAISVVVMSALTSVVLTSVRSFDTATNRAEASSQIRNFQSMAYGDFALSQIPQNPCMSPCGAPIVLSGIQVSNAPQPAPTPAQVTYSWDGSSLLDRQVASTGSTTHAATDVTAFSWYLDTSGAYPTVVVSLTVTVGAYSESQTFLFYPRLNP